MAVLLLLLDNVLLPLPGTTGYTTVDPDVAMGIPRPAILACIELTIGATVVVVDVAVVDDNVDVEAPVVAAREAAPLPPVKLTDEAVVSTSIGVPSPL